MSKKKHHRRHVNLRKIYRKYKALYWPKEDPVLEAERKELDKKLLENWDYISALAKLPKRVDKNGMIAVGNTTYD